MSNYSNRIFSLLIISLSFSAIAYKTLAQNIPNGDFEEWTTNGQPASWFTNNIYPPPLECRQVFMGYPPYSGDWCIEGIVDTCPELVTLIPPLIQSYDIPLSSRPAALHGFYKFIPVGEDLFVASIQTYLNSVLIGEGILKSQQFVNGFTEFIINIEYTTTDIPDVAIIKFTIDSSLASNKLHQDSKWYMDYLFFGPLSDVADEQTNIPNTFHLYQNYPNPFNPGTQISWQSPVDSWQTLKIYDVLGNEITTLINEYRPAGKYDIEFNAATLPVNVYFYQLRAGSFVQTRKMILLK